MTLHRGAAELAKLGYQHSDGGLWYDRASLKVFTDEYVWRRDEDSLRADLAADTRGELKIYSSWPLGPQDRVAVERLIGGQGGSAAAQPRATNHLPGSWQARARAASS